MNAYSVVHGHYGSVRCVNGHVAKLVDALRSGRSPRKGMEVRVLSCPQSEAFCEGLEESEYIARNEVSTIRGLYRTCKVRVLSCPQNIIERGFFTITIK